MEWYYETSLMNFEGILRNEAIKSIDDLMKASEELGKPVVYYSSSKPEKHAFYVFDDAIWYEYLIQM